MLVLTRKPREEIRIGNGITITVLRVKGQSVRIGIEAPNDMRIVRGELELLDDDLVPVKSPSTSVEPASAESTRPAITTMDLDDDRACPSMPTPATQPSCPTRIPRATGGSSTLKVLAARQRAVLEAQPMAAPIATLTDQPAMPIRNQTPK